MRKQLEMNKDLGALVDIELACGLISEFIQGIDQGDFKYDERTKSAVVYQLLIIGEATTRLSNKHRSEFDETPWKLMVGMRNALIHGYHIVNWDQVWRTCQKYIPELIVQVKKQTSIIKKREGSI